MTVLQLEWNDSSLHLCPLSCSLCACSSSSVLSASLPIPLPPHLHHLRIPYLILRAVPPAFSTKLRMIQPLAAHGSDQRQQHKQHTMIDTCWALDDEWMIDSAACAVACRSLLLMLLLDCSYMHT